MRLLRLLIIYVVTVVIVVSTVIWTIFKFDLLPFQEAALADPPQPMIQQISLKEPGTGSRTAKAKAQRPAKSRAPQFSALPAHDLTGRNFQTSPLPLSLPVDCQPGIDCWVFNFVDAAPGNGYADFACGRMSYDAHKGTDIAVSDRGRLSEMIPVRAAAAGTVLGVRDGMEDISIQRIGRAAVKGKECGNGVRISHGGGWHTQYCHMKRGSVSVKTGDLVGNGDRIGAVGLSGLTEFPHVHMTVEKSGQVIDPFVGLSGGDKCEVGHAPLWRRDVLEKLRYLSAIPYHVGFADRLPKADEIRAGAFNANTLAATAASLVFWAEIAGLRPGDAISMRFFGPDGALLTKKEEKMTKHRIRIWRAIGKKSKNGWAPGGYRGEVTILRQTPAGPREARREARLNVF
jgi:murein DD-endopeptidase MepM/ murein hydrolase activator NlpD